MLNRTQRRRWVVLFLLLLLGSVLFWERQRRWRESSQDSYILSAAARYGVHPALVKAVVWRESGFDPYAKGSSGELGLMQIMPDTASDWAKAEKDGSSFQRAMLDPARNTRAGTWYLRKLYRRYTSTDNPLPYALADYNAGRGNVLRWAKGNAATNSEAFVHQIGFPSTRDYVLSVMERYHHYSQIFPPKPDSKL